MSESVDSPQHYLQGKIECIEVIRSALGDGFADYCRGNVIKYVWRYKLKSDPATDLRKARWYLDRMIEEVESG